MYRKLLAGALLAATLIMSACAVKVDSAKVDSVGFLYAGPVRDHGWNHQHDLGREAVAWELGMDTPVVGDVAAGADAERAIRDLVSSGSDVIIATSYEYQDALIKTAAEFPEVRFEHATGDRRTDNISTYSGRFYEGRTITGTIAGHMSKRGRIGYIASHPIPEVVRGINAFTIAARKVNPAATVEVVWVNSWRDADKEAQAARQLISRGADIITQHTNSPAPLQVAEERGIYAFGQNSNMEFLAPRAQLTAILPNWSGYYVDRVRAAADGAWESRATWGGLSTGMVKLAPYGDAVPAEVRAAADRVAASIVNGNLHPFAGPITDRNGTLRVKAGEALSDEALLGMDWYVEGVLEEQPQ